MKRTKENKGVTVLPVVLLIGGIIVEIGIAGGLIAFYSLQSNMGIKTANEALGMARSGIEDAIMKIVRDKNISMTTTTVALGGGSADVSIIRDIPSAGKDTITSIGKMGIGVNEKKRKLQSVVNVDIITGELRVEWLREIPL